MKYPAFLLLIALTTATLAAPGGKETLPTGNATVIARGLDRPHAITVSEEGAIYVADKTGIRKIVNGEPRPFSAEQAVAVQAWKKHVYACGERDLKRIDEQGKATILAAAEKFRDA